LSETRDGLGREVAHFRFDVPDGLRLRRGGARRRLRRRAGGSSRDVQRLVRLGDVRARPGAADDQLLAGARHGHVKQPSTALVARFRFGSAREQAQVRVEDDHVPPLQALGLVDRAQTHVVEHARLPRVALSLETDARDLPAREHLLHLEERLVDGAENRDIVGRAAAAQETLDVVRDKRELRLVRAEQVHVRQEVSSSSSSSSARAHGHVRAARDFSVAVVRVRDDRGRRPEVRGQRACDVGRERIHETRVRPAELVDVLRSVAHRKNEGPVATELGDHVVLLRTDVLKLVDENVLHVRQNALPALAEELEEKRRVLAHVGHRVRRVAEVRDVVLRQPVQRVHADPRVVPRQVGKSLLHVRGGVAREGGEDDARVRHAAIDQVLDPGQGGHGLPAAGRRADEHRLAQGREYRSRLFLGQAHGRVAEKECSRVRREHLHVTLEASAGVRHGVMRVLHVASVVQKPVEVRQFGKPGLLHHLEALAHGAHVLLRLDELDHGGELRAAHARALAQDRVHVEDDVVPHDRFALLHGPVKRAKDRPRAFALGDGLALAYAVDRLAARRDLEGVVLGRVDHEVGLFDHAVVLAKQPAYGNDAALVEFREVSVLGQALAVRARASGQTGGLCVEEEVHRRGCSAGQSV
jgi:hypothetical protein